MEGLQPESVPPSEPLVQPEQLADWSLGKGPVPGGSICPPAELDSPAVQPQITLTSSSDRVNVTPSTYFKIHLKVQGGMVQGEVWATASSAAPPASEFPLKGVGRSGQMAQLQKTGIPRNGS